MTQSPPPPADLAMQTTHILLQALRPLSGAQYPKLLQQSGLDRFLSDPTRWPTDAPLTTAEIQLLTQVVWNQLGEVLFRLYAQNMGTAMAHSFLQSPLAQAMRTAAQALPPDEQLAAALNIYYQQMRHSRPDSRLQETPAAWHLTYDPCVACLGINGAHAPICSAASIVTKQLLTHAVGRRITITEIACHAQGASACVFAIAK